LSIGWDCSDEDHGPVAGAWGVGLMGIYSSMPIWREPLPDGITAAGAANRRSGGTGDHGSHCTDRHHAATGRAGVGIVRRLGLWPLFASPSHGCPSGTTNSGHRYRLPFVGWCCWASVSGRPDGAASGVRRIGDLARAGIWGGVGDCGHHPDCLVLLVVGGRPARHCALAGMRVSHGLAVRGGTAETETQPVRMKWEEISAEVLGLLKLVLY